MKKSLTLTLLLLSFSSFSFEWISNGGGTVIGNGAGLVESNFQYAYDSLKKILPHCFQKNVCDLLDEEKMIIKSITTIVHMNSDKEDRLVFLSEKENPGFFTTGVSEPHRIAKTFLNPNAPIYINTDLLYKSAGQPALSFQDILRILIHELGHQTGEQGHASLDILGGKVALFSETNTNYYQYKINNQQKLTFTVTNFEFPVKSSIVIFNWHNDVAVDLSEIIILGSECNHRSESFAGLEVINGHYSINDQGSLSFEAWINVECFESFSGQAFIYKRDMSIDLNEKYKIRGVFIK